MFKRIDRRLFTILMIVFVQMMGASMALPLLPLFARRSFAMEPQVITLLISSFFAAQFLAGPTIGRLSDRYGRIPVLIVSQVGTVISFVMLGVAQSIPVLFLARILDGITGGNIVVAQAYVTDIMPDEKRTEALGYIFAAFGLGFIIGPAAGGILSSAFGPRVPFLIAALAAALTVILTHFALDESLSPEQRASNRQRRKGGLDPRSVTSNLPLMLILLVGFVGQFGLGMLQATFALYGELVLFAGYSEQISSLGIGLLLACVGLGQFFTQMFLLQRLLKRHGDARLVLAGGFLRGLAMYGLAIVTSPFLAAPGTLLFAIGSGIMMPPLQALATRTVEPRVRGGVLGLFQSAASLSTIFSTALGGTIFAINPTYPYWISGTLFMVTTVFSVLLLRWTAAGMFTPKPVPTGD